MKLRIKHLTKAEKYLKNLPIPPQDPNDLGNVGRHIENLIQSCGYDLDRQDNVDIRKIGVEIKTRNIWALSAHTIGKMRMDDIISTPWDESPVKEKIQCQFRVEYDDKLNIITEAKIWNFDIHEIQYSLQTSYEQSRKMFANSKFFPDTYIRANQLGHLSDAYFENTTNTNFWDFRVSDNVMRRFKKIVLGKEQYNRLFDHG